MSGRALRTNERAERISVCACVSSINCDAKPCARLYCLTENIGPQTRRRHAAVLSLSYREYTIAAYHQRPKRTHSKRCPADDKVAQPLGRRSRVSVNGGGRSVWRGVVKVGAREYARFVPIGRRHATQLSSNGC